jgi:hypothetical protein
VRLTLETWRLQAALDPVEAVALQLVSNAVESTGTMDYHLDLRHVDDLSIIVVSLRQAETAVLVEVQDSSPEPPIGPPTAGHESGYYMLGGGKVVWTAVTRPPPEQARPYVNGPKP